MRQSEPLVLASASPARLSLMRNAGLDVTAIPADVDEAEIKRAFAPFSVETAVVRLADAKASEVALRRPGALVIGADQMLVCDGVRYDKPRSPNEARSHLVSLRGRRHVLATGVVCRRGSTMLWRFATSPGLSMCDISDAFLDDYLEAEGEAAMTTVGGYRVEGLGIRLFDRIDGEHAAILGLPMLPLLGFLRDAGVLGR